MQPEVSVRVYTQDGELRAWLVDELALMSPMLEVKSIESLDASAAHLLIVSTDALAVADVERLRTIAIPVIAIGAVGPQLAAIPFASVLDAKLTSRQLKRAVRDSLANRVALPAPAAPA
jgi:hypothetical protein